MVLEYWDGFSQLNGYRKQNECGHTCIPVYAIMVWPGDLCW